MEGTLVINEKRGAIDKFKEFYQTKVIDAQVNQKVENILLKSNEYLTKAGEYVDNVGLKFIVIYYPEIKPFEAAINAALPYYWKVKKQIGDGVIKGIMKTKGFIDAKFLGTDGSIKDVTIPEKLYDNLELEESKGKTL